MRSFSLCLDTRGGLIVFFTNDETTLPQVFVINKGATSLWLGSKDLISTIMASSSLVDCMVGCLAVIKRTCVRISKGDVKKVEGQL